MTFEFERRWYVANASSFYIDNRCVLPDGRTIAADSWLDSPLEPQGLRVVEGVVAIAEPTSPPDDQTRVVGSGNPSLLFENQFVVAMPPGPDHFATTPIVVDGSDPELVATTAASFFAHGTGGEKTEQELRVTTRDVNGDSIEWSVARRVSYIANRVYQSAPNPNADGN